MELYVRVYSKDRAELELQEKSVVIAYVDIETRLSRILLKEVIHLIENKEIERIVIEGGKATFSSYKIALVIARVIGWYRSIAVVAKE